MQQDRLWILIARKLTGEASDIELLELDKELKANADAFYEVEMLLGFWETGLSNVKVDVDAIERVWQRINLFTQHKICYQ